METTANMFAELTYHQRNELFSKMVSATHECHKLENFCSQSELDAPVRRVHNECADLLNDINAADGI